MDDQHSAFETIFRRFQPALVQFAYMHLRSQEEAREVVQEVFIKIWLKRDSLEFNQDLKAYLYRAVRNESVNKIKRNRLNLVALDDWALAVPEESGGEEDRKQRRIRKIFQQIDALPANCKEIFMMSRMEGLSHKEIAGILDISPKTVENQIGIALKKIRKGVK